MPTQAEPDDEQVPSRHDLMNLLRDHVKKQVEIDRTTSPKPSERVQQKEFQTPLPKRPVKAGPRPVIDAAAKTYRTDITPLMPMLTFRPVNRGCETPVPQKSTADSTTPKLDLTASTIPHDTPAKRRWHADFDTPAKKTKLESTSKIFKYLKYIYIFL